MSQRKPLSKIKKVFFIIVIFFLTLWLRFTHFTCRKKYTNEKAIVDLFENGECFVMSIWHNRMTLEYFGYRAFKNKKRSVTPLVSQSNDGTLADIALNLIGVNKAIRGSSSRGGSAGLKEMMRAARSGKDLAFAIDGPKGPLYEIKGGVLAAAKITGLPVLPCTWSAKTSMRLKTWDRLILAAPFSKLHFVFGDPIYIPRKCTDEEFEAFRQKLTTEMLRINTVSKAF